MLTTMGINFMWAQSQPSKAHYMIIQVKDNILDCPHFGQKLSIDFSNEYSIPLVEKNDQERRIIFDVSHYTNNLDTLKSQYIRYLKKIEFPINRYFDNITFSNDKN